MFTPSLARCFFLLHTSLLVFRESEVLEAFFLFPSHSIVFFILHYFVYNSLFSAVAVAIIIIICLTVMCVHSALGYLFYLFLRFAYKNKKKNRKNLPFRRASHKGNIIFGVLFRFNFFFSFVSYCIENT